MYRDDYLKGVGICAGHNAPEEGLWQVVWCKWTTSLNV